MRTVIVCLMLLLGSAGAQIPGLPSLPALPSVPGLPTSLPRLPAMPDVPALPGAASDPTAPAPNPLGTYTPDYSERKAVFSLPDLRLEQLAKGRPPFLEVIERGAFQTYQKNRDECRAAETAKQPYPDAAKCPQYEWSVPYSTEDASRDAAQDLRRAWQRLEDRYYWRAMVKLNNPAFYMSYCWLNWGGGVEPERPETRVTVRAEDLEGSLRAKVPLSEPDPKLNLDSYFPLPQVENKDFCDDINFEILPIMFIPGFCIAFVGVDVLCTDEYPKPIWFNNDEAIGRVAEAIRVAHTKYWLEYQEDAIRALTPASDGRLLFPLPWRSNVPGDGAFIAPIINTDVSPQQYLDLGQQASSILGGLEGANAAPYYLQSVLRSPTLAWLALPGLQSVVGSPPGAWRLEELKRLLKPSNPVYYERVGYATMFEAWQDMTTTVLPEPIWAKPLRPLLYWAVGLRVNIDPFGCGICVTPTPAPVGVAPYLLPFAAPRFSWTWTSVPEGYGIPRVKGVPLFDYRPLVRAEAGR